MNNISTSVIAHCLDCDWFCECLDNARIKAYMHNKNTGHKVMVEIARSIHYERIFKK